MPQQLNAELALLEARKIERPLTGSDRASVEELRQRASKKGYGLIARKAAVLLD